MFNPISKTDIRAKPYFYNYPKTIEERKEEKVSYTHLQLTSMYLLVEQLDTWTFTCWLLVEWLDA